MLGELIINLKQNSKNAQLSIIYSPFLISSLESRHLLYFQLRKSVLERQILCNEDDLITLGGIALQAEIGDFNENVCSFYNFFYQN